MDMLLAVSITKEYKDEKNLIIYIYNCIVDIL